MKTLIGVPCSDTIKSRTAFDLFQLRSEDVDLVMQRGCDVAHNRNMLAQQALDRDFTHLLFIDSDMSFQPNMLDLMLAHDKDIFGLACNRRKLPLESVVKPLNEDDVNKELPKYPFEAASVGTGVMLIKTDVFRNMTPPWFDFTYGLYALKKPSYERFGEDVNFCRKAREAGYQIWVDPTIPVRHIGEYLF